MPFLIKELLYVIDRCDNKNNSTTLLPYIKMVNSIYDFYRIKAIDNPDSFMDFVHFFNSYTVARNVGSVEGISFQTLKKRALKYGEKLFPDIPDDLAKKLTFYFLDNFNTLSTRHVFEVSKGHTLLSDDEIKKYIGIFELRYKSKDAERVNDLEALLSGKLITKENHNSNICEPKVDGVKNGN